jgi:hypothetical protein
MLIAILNCCTKEELEEDDEETPEPVTPEATIDPITDAETDSGACSRATCDVN